MNEVKKSVRITLDQFLKIQDHLPIHDSFYVMDYDYGDHGILQLYTDYAVTCYELVKP